MKEVIFTILFFIAISATGQTFEKEQNDSLKDKAITTFREIYWNNLPSPQGWINDYERIFSDDEEKKLDNIISSFERETSIEIAIVTIDTVKTSSDKFEALSLHIAKTWGIGKKGKDNGILIGLSKGYRKIRIELGNGIAKVLTEQETKEIIDHDFIPEFKKGNYYQGIVNGITKLMEVLRTRIKRE
ncbi:TPM domain-containing protein [Flavobacterium sp. FlaQc-30]|uniref:TPM domain-containing protein n=1 Tax=Flavobacterium sp. FlaQc-30 TaxID=3374179 RepID=UPI003757C489